jgi:type IX secretion system PorP/SprF family membrane protein
MKQLLTLIFISTILGLNAQDGHFSQFYASPMALNPALTGLSAYKLKATAQYREQWRSVTVPYLSTQGGIEGRFNSGFNNAIGAGLYVANNEAGDAQFTNPQIYLSGSFHKGLDNEGSSFISAGGQIGAGQRSINNNLSFNSQYDGSLFNINIPSGEWIDNQQISYVDGSVGVAYSMLKDDQTSAYVGLAIFHLNRPNISFVRNTRDPLDRKLTFYAGGSFPLTDQLSLILQGVILNQGPFNEVNAGVLMRYSLIKGYYENAGDLALTVGTIHRFDDAQIFVGRLDYRTFSIGISYDYNFSSLTSASSSRGGVEVALVYQIGEIERGRGCPVF